jgi:hypothetical protein
MDFTEKLCSFAILGGQHAPVASDGVGVRILYQCRVCKRIWLQDGMSAIMDLRPEQIQRFAQELSADLDHVPLSTCRICLLRTGGGSVEIDEYQQGEGFGFCWEIPHPVVLHATSAILSQKGSLTFDTQPDVLTQQEKLRAILHVVKDAPFPHRFEELPAPYCQLQAMTLRPGFGQAGTEHWRWRGWAFFLDCPPLDGNATVTFMIALPEMLRLPKPTVFAVWQFLMEVTLLGGLPEQA